MIRSFACKQTEAIFCQQRVGKFSPDVQRQALRKLLIIDAAINVNDLRIPPGNQLEKLTGNRKGQWSIRINKQWRICFRWRHEHAYDVAIIDYH